MTPDEREAYEQALKEEDNRVFFDSVKDVWELSKEVHYPDFDSISALKKHKTLLNKPNETRPSGKQGIIYKMYRPFYKIAAVFLLIIASVWVYRQWLPETYDEGNMRYVLEDQSTVWLADDARIVVRFSEGKRRVKLTGKAYFDVAGDTERPFIIDAGPITVSVKGTSFIVDEQHGSVAVREGLVLVESRTQQAELTADQKISWHEHVLGAKVDLASDSLNLWFNEELKFSQAPLDTVMKDISAFFGVEIRLSEDKDWSQCPFTSGPLKNNSLDQVLEILRSAYSMDFKREDQYLITVSNVRCP
jgi:ferric-dicitrate binding protein FerR (iron transport regulator)